MTIPSIDLISLETKASLIDRIIGIAPATAASNPIETLLSSEIIAYKIKYNITEMMFYSPNEENKLRRLYKFNEYLENKVTKALIVCQGSGSESAVYIEH